MPLINHSKDVIVSHEREWDSLFDECAITTCIEMAVIQGYECV